MSKHISQEQTNEKDSTKQHRQRITPPSLRPFLEASSQRKQEQDSTSSSQASMGPSVGTEDTPLFGKTEAPHQTTKPSSTTPSLMLPNRKLFYVNMVVVDATDAIDRQLQHEFKDIPKPIHAVATKLAATWATPERVAEAMTTELPRDIEHKMALRGVTVTAETSFWQGPYVVVQLQVRAVSPTTLVEARSQNFYDEFGDLEEGAHMSPTWAMYMKGCIQRILAWLGVRTQQTLENETLPWLIQLQMENVMNESVEATLQRTRLRAIAKVLPEERQARYFFETLRRVREANKPFAQLAELAESLVVHRGADIEEKKMV